MKRIELENKVVYKDTLDDEQIFIEQIILGLRMIKGINEEPILLNQPNEKKEKFIKTKEELIKIGLIEENRGIIRLTDRGLDLANQVFVKFME